MQRPEEFVRRAEVALVCDDAADFNDPAKNPHSAGHLDRIEREIRNVADLAPALRVTEDYGPVHVFPGGETNRIVGVRDR